MATINKLIPYGSSNLWLAANIVDSSYYTMVMINSTKLLTSSGLYQFTINGTSTKKQGYRQAQTFISVSLGSGTSIESFKPYDVSGKYGDTTRTITNGSDYSFYAFKSPNESNKTLLLVNNVNGVLSDIDSEKTYKIEFTDSNGDYDSVNFNIETIGNVKVGVIYNIDIDLDYSIEISTDTTPEPEPEPTFTITNNIADSTAEYSVTSKNNYDITVSCADGYTFEKATISYTDYESGDYTTENLIINGNKATISISTYDSSVEINGNIKVVTKTLDLTNNLSGTTATYELLDSKFNITIKGDSDGTFDSCQITYIDSDGDEVTYDVPTVGNIGTYSLTTDITSATITGTFTPKKDVTAIEYRLTNCVVTGTKQESVEYGGTVAATLQANDNAKLTEIQGVYTDSDGDSIVTTGTISSDGKTGNVTFIFPTGATSPYIYANAEIIEPVGTNYGAINVYSVTLDNLEKFSKSRFFRFTDTETQTNEQIDLGVYVNRLKRLFVDVPVSGEDVIKCGNYNTGVTCNAPKTDIITLDFGYLTITGINGNTHDYESTLQMFLPFVGFVTLDNTFVDKTINLTYKVNIVTGDGVAIISYLGTPVLLQNVSVSRDVLYKTGNYTLQTIGGDSFDENSLYGFEPYVLMNYTVSQALTQHTTNKDVIVGDITGLARFENVNVDVNCLADEQNEIQNLLNTGVIL